MNDEEMEMIVLTREEYQRFWQIVEELETLMWKIKNENEDPMMGED